jgi:hypothetical protein
MKMKWRAFGQDFEDKTRGAKVVAKVATPENGEDNDRDEQEVGPRIPKAFGDEEAVGLQQPKGRGHP